MKQCFYVDLAKENTKSVKYTSCTGDVFFLINTSRCSGMPISGCNTAYPVVGNIANVMLLTRDKGIFIFCDTSTVSCCFSDGVCKMYNAGGDTATSGDERLFRSFSGLANVAANGPVSASAPYTEK